MKRTFWNPFTGHIETREVQTMTYVTKVTCSCGSNILKETVALGKKYEVIPDSKAPGSLDCGDCGKTMKLELVLVKDGALYCPMPWEMFVTSSKGATA
jgi:hypothetical protein